MARFPPAGVHTTTWLITHLFRRGAQYLDADAVFGVKDQLVVPFERRPPGRTPDRRVCHRPWLIARHDFVLQPTNPSG